MGSGLTRKWKNIKPIMIPLLAIIVILLCRSISDNRKYPYLVEEQWVCTKPYATLSYIRDDSNALLSSEIIVLDNQTIEVEIGFLMREYCVYLKDCSSYDDRLFSGTWKYEGENLVLTIDEDFLFDNRYSKLVFSPVKTK